MQSDYHKEFETLIRSISHSRQSWQAFSDFVEISAISLFQPFNRKEEREKRYLEIVGRYDREEVQTFCRLLAITVAALEESKCDFLGEMFMRLELGSHFSGQFFTPFQVCQMMGSMILADKDVELEKNGFITVMEPCVGAGAMVIGLAQAMMEKGINYQRCLHVTAVDISPTAAQMAYMQLSLLHIPAIVYIGDSLTMEMRESFVTPAHIMGFWGQRLKENKAGVIKPDPAQARDEPPIKEVPEIKEPAYPIIKPDRPIQPSLFA